MSMPATTLYCLPYAGGNAYSYRALESHLAPGCRIAGVELPGRGRRTQEPLSFSMEALAGDVFAQLRPHLERGRYALFGHSMGAALAYLCLHRIKAAGLPYPEAVFLSGKRAPSFVERKARHLLPRDEFVDVLRDLGGCPPELLQEKELLDYFEPILRADFQAVETWEPLKQPPLPVPLVVFRGLDDEVSRDEALAWKQETSAGFQLHEFDGDHFFIQRHWPKIARLIETGLGLATVSAHGQAWAPLGAPSLARI